MERKRAFIFKWLQEVFESQEVSILNYFHQIKLERAEEIAMQTLDGLGIIGQDNGSSYSFAVDRSCNESEMKRMGHFLSKANSVEKLAFIRDAHYWYILASDYDEAVSKLIIKLLESLGLKDEVGRVAEKI